MVISKTCSEEGVEDATALLLQSSRGISQTREVVLRLLLNGARELGIVVCEHLHTLMLELRNLNAKIKIDKGDKLEDEVGDGDGCSSEISPVLQLPSMTVLTSKISFQAAFLHILKVIIRLREAARRVAKKTNSIIETEVQSEVEIVMLHENQANNTAASADVAEDATTAAAAAEKEAAAAEKEAAAEAIAIAAEATEAVEDAENTAEYAATMAEEVAKAAKTGVALQEAVKVIVSAVKAAEAAAKSIEAATKSIEAAAGAIESASELTAAAAELTAAAADLAAAAAEVPLDVDFATSISIEANFGSQEDQQQQPVPKSGQQAEAEDVRQRMPCLSSQLKLCELWETLSSCLVELADTPDHHAVLVLQPAVEAFFLVHASAVDKESERKRESRMETRESQLSHIHQDIAPLSPLPVDAQAAASRAVIAALGSHDMMMMMEQSHANVNLPPDTHKFLKFAETHRTVLNQILRQSTTPLADGPFAVLVDHAWVLDFDIKRRYFRQELERMDEGICREDLAVYVRREHVFEDSFQELHRWSSEDWKNRFYIVFEGEEGQDAGGLLREWYTVISREIFNPMYALFTTSPGDRVTYMINPSSRCNSNHLSYFKFVGRVIAKAVYDNKLLECYFTRSFYKHILGKSVKYQDMESEDYAFYQGLVFLLEHDIKTLDYEVTFSTVVQQFGVTKIRDLKPNGRNILVTEENKHEYVRFVCQMKMTGAIRKQLKAFLKGFYDIIPKRLISIFNEQELELLISGLPVIDIDDLKSNTEYHKYQLNSLQIQWFWRALRSFDQADRAKFLQFVTGTSKVPLQGFAALEGMNGTQNFQIHKDDGSTDRLPSAHTCFNQLNLPAYETYDKLRSMLLKAIHECSEGFGFA